MSAAAVALLVGLPLATYFLAPAALAADPGADLAGINAYSTGVAIQVSPLTPGLVGAGDVTQGDLFEAAVPYSNSTSSTGPANATIATPAYPGSTASELGTVFNTFQPLPSSLIAILNDPVLARADFPPQVGVGQSGSYSAPGGAILGAGTATASADQGATSGTANVSSTSLLGSLISVGSSTASTNNALTASSITATAHSDVGAVSLLAGLVKIAGLASDASATSNGTSGTQTSGLEIGSVTVAGIPAYIGPDGLHLQSANQGILAITALNEVLKAMQQVGLTIRTIAPVTTVEGAAASVTSGAVQIAFEDSTIPNPDGQIPISSLGLDINLGLSQASANATALPPFVAFPTGPATTLPAVISPPSPSVTLPTTVSPSPPGSNPVSYANPVAAPGPAQIQETPSLATTPTTTAEASGNLPAVEPASVMGLPVRVGSVILAFIVSLLLAGALLGYANWQLLRGRRS